MHTYHPLDALYTACTLTWCMACMSASMSTVGGARSMSMYTTPCTPTIPLLSCALRWHPSQGLPLRCLAM